MPGYHLAKIKKGMIGCSSKIQEEVEELVDAEQQESCIMAFMEASDVYGALEAWVECHGLKMDDLKKMSDITRRAFKNGDR